MSSRKHWCIGFLCRPRYFFFILGLLHTAPGLCRDQVTERDSVRITRLLDSAITLEGTNRKAALQVYREIIRLSEDVGYVLGKAKALHYSAIVYSDENQYAESLHHYREAVKFYKEINNARGIGACYGNSGNLFLYQGKLDSALAYYHIGIKIFEQHNLQDALSQMYGNAGVVFERLKQYDNAAFYFDRSLNLARQEQDSVMLCRALTNKGTLLFALKRFDESIALHQTALSLAKKIGDDYSIQNEYINLADCFQSKGLYAEAIQYGLNALEYSVKIGTPFDIADTKKRIGDLYLAADRAKEAERYYFEAIAQAENIKALELKASAYHSLQELYARAHNYKAAYQFQLLAKQHQDSIVSEKQLNTIHELEVRYQTLRKDRELAHNKIQLQESRQYVIFSAGAALIATLTTALIVLYFRNKRKAYLRQLETVRKEKEVQVLQALMQGEEKERVRIAHTLHDEVSGMLAATKMHLNTISNTSPAVTQSNGYQKAIDLLDETAVRVRNTAHNLLPEVLMQNGLEKALQKYCANISHDQLLPVRFYSMGNVIRYAHNFELAVYRIVQELLNNIIKHARATEVLVQIGVDDTILFVTVEDNGIGFTLGKNASDGIGLKSLESRIEALNGKIDISSQQGEGVSIHIEFETAVG